MFKNILGNLYRLLYTLYDNFTYWMENIGDYVDSDWGFAIPSELYVTIPVWLTMLTLLFLNILFVYLLVRFVIWLISLLF